MQVAEKTRLYNYQEIADIFRVGRRTVQQWVYRGKLHVVAKTPGGQPRISQDEIDRFTAHLVEPMT